MPEKSKTDIERIAFESTHLQSPEQLDGRTDPFKMERQQYLDTIKGLCESLDSLRKNFHETNGQCLENLKSLEKSIASRDATIERLLEEISRLNDRNDQNNRQLSASRSQKRRPTGDRQ